MLWCARSGDREWRSLAAPREGGSQARGESGRTAVLAANFLTGSVEPRLPPFALHPSVTRSKISSFLGQPQISHNRLLTRLIKHPFKVGAPINRQTLHFPLSALSSRSGFEGVSASVFRGRTFSGLVVCACVSPSNSGFARLLKSDSVKFLPSQGVAWFFLRNESAILFRNAAVLNQVSMAAFSFTCPRRML